MGDCKECTGSCKEMEPGQVPNIQIIINYNDYRVSEDNSNYIDNVEMGSEE